MLLMDASWVYPLESFFKTSLPFDLAIKQKPIPGNDLVDCSPWHNGC